MTTHRWARHLAMSAAAGTLALSGTLGLVHAASATPHPFTTSQGSCAGDPAAPKPPAKKDPKPAAAKPAAAKPAAPAPAPAAAAAPAAEAGACSVKDAYKDGYQDGYLDGDTDGCHDQCKKKEKLNCKNWDCLLEREKNCANTKEYKAEYKTGYEKGYGDGWKDGQNGNGCKQKSWVDGRGHHDHH